MGTIEVQTDSPVEVRLGSGNPRRLRVCMFVTTDVTGDARVMKQATALAHAGHEVIVFGARRSGRDLRREARPGVEIRRLDLWHMRLVRWLKGRRGLTPTQGFFGGSPQDAAGREAASSRLVGAIHQAQYLVHLATVLPAFARAGARTRADVYHAQDLDVLLPALWLGRRQGKPVIYDAHEYWYGVRSHERVRHALVCAIEGWGTRRCAHVFTVNRSIAERMAAHYQIPVPSVLMNVPAQAVSQAPGPLGPGESLRLLYLGGFFAQRGLETLVSAVALVRAPVHLTLRGYGDREVALRKQVESLGLENRVTFAPPVPVDQVVRSAMSEHVGVLPFERASSFQLSLPNKLFEYMAAGLAIVTNHLAEIASLVQEHEIGTVYDSDDPAALAGVIEELAGHVDRVNQWRRRSWELYRDQFAWERHQRVLLDVYDELGQGVAPRAAAWR